jgi:Flp pilus assembly protein TadB
VVNDQLRIGDAEREGAARELGEHFAMGRITADEHGERLEQIWSARTAADLAPAFRDLPRPRAQHAPQVHPAATRDVRRSRDRRPERPHVPFLFKVLVGIVALWWGLHHLLYLVVAVAIYLLVVRRFVYRFTRPRRPWHGRYHAGWH